jgi:hypothetical protein
MKKPQGHTTDKVTPLGKFIREQMALVKTKPHVRVGFPKGEDFEKIPAEYREESNKPLTVGEVAVIHEFGTDDIPERSFIRSTHDEKRESWKKDQRTLLLAIQEKKMTIEKALSVMGVKIKAAIQEKIGSNIPPPNDPDTIVKKLRRAGFKVTTGTAEGAGAVKNTTLIDTGQMRQSVNFTKHIAGKEKKG